MRVAMFCLASALAFAVTAVEAAKAEVLLNRPFFAEGDIIDGRCSPCVSRGAAPDHRGWAFVNTSRSWSIDGATLWIDVPGPDALDPPMRQFSLSIWDRTTNLELLHEDFVFLDIAKTELGTYQSRLLYRIDVSLPDWELVPGSYLFSYFGDLSTQWLTAREGLATGYSGYQTTGATSPIDGILLPDASPRNWFFVLRGDVTDVPEPAMTGLLGLGALMLGLRRRPLRGAVCLVSSSTVIP